MVQVHAKLKMKLHVLEHSLKIQHPGVGFESIADVEDSIVAIQAIVSGNSIESASFFVLAFHN
jgi:hypothetical protein